MSRDETRAFVGRSFIDGLFALYERYGHDHYDEDVSQIAHALQTAACAERDKAPASLVAAALLHDVGHLWLEERGAQKGGEDRDLKHELVAAQRLRERFGPEVTEPIRLHVAAKRYLCTVDRRYRSRLSHASQVSLERQGGTMSDAELAAFDREPFAHEALTLRRWDEAAKDPNRRVRSMQEYRPLLESLLR